MPGEIWRPMKIYGNVGFLEELVFYEKAVMYHHRKKNQENWQGPL